MDRTPGDQVQQVLARLRGTGSRLTAARRAVVETLIEAGEDHVTAEDLATRVRARHPDIHRATVYRTLEKLQEAGIVFHVHLGHGPSTFHLADRPHHHAVCRSCGAMVELPVDALDELERRLRDEHGWTLTRQHFALSALCDRCG